MNNNAKTARKTNISGEKKKKGKKEHSSDTRKSTRKPTNLAQREVITLIHGKYRQVGKIGLGSSAKKEQEILPQAFVSDGRDIGVAFK